MSKEQNDGEFEGLPIKLIERTLKSSVFGDLPSTYCFEKIIGQVGRAGKNKKFLIAALKLERDNFNRPCDEKIKELTKED